MGPKAAPTPASVGDASKAEIKDKLPPWTSDMINTMLRLRFEHPVISKRLRNAKTNHQKDVAWWYFAAVLTEELGMVITDKQVCSKYAKVKSEHTKFVQDVGRTGNQVPTTKPPVYLPVLREWFAGRKGVASSVLFDTDAASKTASNTAAGSYESTADGVEEDGASNDDEKPAKKKSKTEQSNTKKFGVGLLAEEMGRGMVAIAQALQGAPEPNATNAILEQQQAMVQLAARLLESQQTQTALLQRLIEATKKD